MIFVLILIIFILLYAYGTRNHTYWLKKGVKFEKPLPLFGNTLRVFFTRNTMSDLLFEMYQKYPDEGFVGYYFANRVSLLLRDPELIKRVFKTDFQHFHCRGFAASKDIREPMMKNLFAMDGDKWKLIRQRLTPAFTNAKVKAMFPLIVERAEKLQVYAAKVADSNEEIDVRELMARYGTDFIGACIFGIDTDALTEDTSTFLQLGSRIFDVTGRDAFVRTLKMLAPETFKHLNVFVPEIEKNIVSLMKTVMRKRNYKPSGRNDFLDLILELKQLGTIVGDSIENTDSEGNPLKIKLELDDLLMAAQMFLFFSAGYETSSSSTSFLLNQLAFHPEIQEKCHKEIDKVLSRHNNKLSYEAITEMKYLEMAFREGMRIFPVVGNLMRVCTKKYTLPGTNVTIDEGVQVQISVQSLHNDEKYFDEPERFIPERFHPDCIGAYKDVFMPYGMGPRACLGERLGHLQSLAGVAALLSKFKFVPSKNSVLGPVTDPHSHVVQSIKNGHPLCLVSRKRN